MGFGRCKIKAGDQAFEMLLVRKYKDSVDKKRGRESARLENFRFGLTSGIYHSDELCGAQGALVVVPARPPEASIRLRSPL